MVQHWFEIVRRNYNRYSWLFVEVRDGRRRVLAYSVSDYRSRKRARPIFENHTGNGTRCLAVQGNYGEESTGQDV